MTRVANDAEIRRLDERRPESTRPFDLRVLPEAELAELRLDGLRDAWSAARMEAGDPESFPPLERWLGQRDLARLVDREWRPTVAGVLLHGLSPTSWLPGACVELSSHAGDDVTDPVVFRKTITGTLSEQLDAVWTQLLVLNVMTPRPGGAGLRTVYGPAYPEDALRELARNLVQHRDYAATRAPARIAWLSGSIVFTNPGGPFGQAGQGELGDHSDYRNPTLTQHLAALGYVERLGRGLAIVRKRLAVNGNPPLEVATDGYTRVTVRSVT